MTRQTVLAEKYETVYQTAHFEAVPCADGKYELLHRDGERNLACGRLFPAEVASIALEALEEGFQRGVEAMYKSVAQGFPPVLKIRRETFRGHIAPETTKRPIR